MKRKLMTSIMATMAVMAVMALGSTDTLTAKADGVWWDPCSHCGGSIWVSETNYERLLETRVCEHGYTKGTDCYYEYFTRYEWDCLDCDMTIDCLDMTTNFVWRCEGYN